jgi:NAD-reducing hydrogenase small subunit
MDRLKIATIWLGGCSGCHMSFLDLDEWLIELVGKAEIVYSPLMDIKEFPKGVDATLVEGAVANKDNLELLRTVRANSKLIIAFGDCAVTGNVTAMRNIIECPRRALETAYLQLSAGNKSIPNEPGILPELLTPVVPIHQVVAVDAFIPGCPPSAQRIKLALELLLNGQPVILPPEELKFG